MIGWICHDCGLRGAGDLPDQHLQHDYKILDFTTKCGNCKLLMCGLSGGKCQQCGGRLVAIND